MKLKLSNKRQKTYVKTIKYYEKKIKIKDYKNSSYIKNLLGNKLDLKIEFNQI